MHPKSDLQIPGETEFFQVFLRFANGGHGKAINSEKMTQKRGKNKKEIENQGGGGVRTSK